MQSRSLCIGKIIGAHGIRGEVKIHAYTEEPEALERYAPITDKLGKCIFKIKIRSSNKDILIAAVDGVSSRNEAELLKNTELYLPRERLPILKEDNIFYIEDLKGLKVLNEKDHKEWGVVKDIYNYGASDIVAIVKTDNEEELFALSQAVFPEINVFKGYMVIRIPEIDHASPEEKSE